MRKLNVDQRSNEWMKLRSTKIGASDAPVIAGVSPYKTAFQLWEEKIMNKSQAVSHAMAWGTNLEPIAREQYELMTGYIMTPCVVLHPTQEWKMASLDGMDESGKHIVEIKCANKDDHAIAVAGNVPEKYMPQLQHQMDVCETDTVNYFSFDGTQGVIVIVKRDESFIRKLNDLEEEFYDHMLSFTPPQMSDKDFAPIEDQAFIDAIARWNELEPLVKEYEDLRKSMIEMANGKNRKGMGIKILRYAQKGRVDYAAIPELVGVDLERYRKNPSECWKITKTKGE